MQDRKQTLLLQSYAMLHVCSHPHPYTTWQPERKPAEVCAGEENLPETGEISKTIEQWI